MMTPYPDIDYERRCREADAAWEPTPLDEMPLEQLAAISKFEMNRPSRAWHRVRLAWTDADCARREKLMEWTDVVPTLWQFDEVAYAPWGGLTCGSWEDTDEGRQLLTTTITWAE